MAIAGGLYQPFGKCISGDAGGGNIKDTDKENLNHIKTSAETLLSLVNDILNLDRPQSIEKDFKISPVSILKIANSSINTLKPVAKIKNVKIKIENKVKKSDMVIGNSNFLGRAIDNLLSNAIKFTLSGGNVRVVIEPHQNNQLAISVIDTGMGIPEQNIPFLFNKPPETIKGEHGMGTGLSIVKEIVEKHEGHIEVTSEKGKGSCFKLIFPRIINK